MPTKNPRVNIVVEPPLYSVMHDIAASEGVSMSTIARDLIREAIELREDVPPRIFAEALRHLSNGKTYPRWRCAVTRENLQCTRSLRRNRDDQRD